MPAAFLSLSLSPPRRLDEALSNIDIDAKRRVSNAREEERGGWRGECCECIDIELKMDRAENKRGRAVAVLGGEYNRDPRINISFLSRVFHSPPRPPFVYIL